MMDSLEELSIEKWPELQENLRQNWPLNVAGFYAIDINLKNKEMRDAFEFKVYCPYGNMDNGFVAKRMTVGVECIIFTINNTEVMEQALVTTNRIDWSRNVCINLVNPVTLKLLTKIKPLMHFQYYYVGMLRTYYLDRNTKQFSDVRCPPGTYLAPVKKDYIRRVDDTWPYKHAESHFYFSTLASNSLSYGLYSNDHKLLAWVFINEYNFLCHLYCEDYVRRNGYAEYLMKCAVNEQLRVGNDLYGYVVEDNLMSANLFKKLGFVDIGDGAYLDVQK